MKDMDCICNKEDNVHCENSHNKKSDVHCHIDATNKQKKASARGISGFDESFKKNRGSGQRCSENA